MTLVFRRGSAYDKDKIAGLQLYTAHLTGEKTLCSTRKAKAFISTTAGTFLRADAFPMAKAVDAHRDAAGHAFTSLPLSGNRLAARHAAPPFNDEDLFRDPHFRTAAAGQRRTAAFYRNILTIPARHKTTRYCLRLRGAPDL